MVITNEEVLKSLGIDLAIELQDDDDPSAKVDRFLTSVVEWCIEYLFIEYGENDVHSIDTLAEFRQSYFKKGVIKQIEYILRNGKTTIDNGFIRETGLVIDLSNIQLAPDAFKMFRAGAFCNI
jgi:hypothetical protein